MFTFVQLCIIMQFSAITISTCLLKRFCCRSTMHSINILLFRQTHTLIHSIEDIFRIYFNIVYFNQVIFNFYNLYQFFSDRFVKTNKWMIHIFFFFQFLHNRFLLCIFLGHSWGEGTLLSFFWNDFLLVIGVFYLPYWSTYSKEFTFIECAICQKLSNNSLKKVTANCYFF